VSARTCMAISARKSGRKAEFNYSPSHETAGIMWNEDTLTNFSRTRARLVRTTTSFIGLQDARYSADIIAYLKEATNRPQAAIDDDDQYPFLLRDPEAHRLRTLFRLSLFLKTSCRRGDAAPISNDDSRKGGGVTKTRAKWWRNSRAKVMRECPYRRWSGHRESPPCVPTSGHGSHLIYNSSKYAMAAAGRSAVCLRMATPTRSREMGAEILPSRGPPVLAGGMNDPFLLRAAFLRECSTGESPGAELPRRWSDRWDLRSSRETVMSSALRLSSSQKRHELDLLTTPYVFNPEEAAPNGAWGADVIVRAPLPDNRPYVAPNRHESLGSASRTRQKIATAPKKSAETCFVLAWRTHLFATRRRVILENAMVTSSSVATSLERCRLKSPSRSIFASSCACASSERH